MRKIFVILLLLSFFVLPVSAEEQKIEIYTPQDLLAIADDPYGSYILMADIDMAGVSWPCPAFFGTLDGNGHAILNLSITQPGAEAVTARDGNYKPYETQTAGLFSYMNSATVKNLTLLGLNANVNSDQPCFLAGIAGVAFDGTVENCTVQGTLELRAHNGMFGVAGLIGYGGGKVEKCSADVTLICVDTDSETKDEQFLGGILANGFMDIKSCDVKLDAYISEFGYVHSGGIVGMYYQKPFDAEASHHGRVVYNTVAGKITFFECNEDRRAYCKAVVGEPVADRWGEDHNKTEGFRRDERKVYDQELRPHDCAAPAFAQTVTVPTCESFGYTTHSCQCGYRFADSYTRKAHSYGDWEVLSQPTAQASGKSRASCAACGTVGYRKEVYVPPVVETTPEVTSPQETTPAPNTTENVPPPVQDVPRQGGDSKLLPTIALIVLGLLALGAIAALVHLQREKKRRRRRRRPKFQR